MNVYAMKHNVTGRVYVGSTTHSPVARCRQHIKLLRQHRHNVEAMQADFDSYGENYSVYLLEVYPGFGRISEGRWMDMLGTKNKERGYNYKDKTGTDVEFSDTSEVSLEDFKPVAEFTGKKPVKTHPIRKDGGWLSPSFKNYEALCSEKGVTSYRVAVDTGIPASTFSDWKSGRSKPKIDKLLRIAEYLGVDIRDLMEVR